MDFWTNPYVIGIAIISALAFIIAMVKRKPTALTTAMVEERERIVDAATKCPCGEIATDPAPVLKRNRGDWSWLRNYYGAPPRYARVVDHMKPVVFCRSHAHVADEMMAQWIFDVRAKYSNLNVEVAAGAAGFEQEHLLAKVKESLTAKQKRQGQSLAPASALRVVPLAAQRTGTEDESGG
jgi:hypothetical protein